MRKIILQIVSFFKHKGYKEDPTANNIWIAAEQNAADAESTAPYSSAAVKLPADIVLQLKQAHKEVQDFEQTLKEIKQNTTI